MLGTASKFFDTAKKFRYAGMVATMNIVFTKMPRAYQTGGMLAAIFFSHLKTNILKHTKP
jgi:hypothetical protein